MTADQIASLANYGVLGLMTLLLVFEKIVPYGRVKREMDTTDKALAMSEKQTEAINRLTSAVEAQNRIAERP